MIRSETKKEIDRAKRIYDVPYWKIAQALGISEMTLYRKLRNELPQEEKDNLLKIIKEVSENDEL